MELAYKKGGGGENHVFVPQATGVQFNPSHKRRYVDQRDRKLQKDGEKLHIEELHNLYPSAR